MRIIGPDDVERRKHQRREQGAGQAAGGYEIASKAATKAIPDNTATFIQFTSDQSIMLQILSRQERAALTQGHRSMPRGNADRWPYSNTSSRTWRAHPWAAQDLRRAHKQRGSLRGTAQSPISSMSGLRSGEGSTQPRVFGSLSHSQFNYVISSHAGCYRRDVPGADIAEHWCSQRASTTSPVSCEWSHGTCFSRVAAITSVRTRRISTPISSPGVEICLSSAVVNGLCGRCRRARFHGARLYFLDFDLHCGIIRHYPTHEGRFSRHA